MNDYTGRMRRTTTSSPGSMLLETDVEPPEVTADRVRIGVEWVGLCGGDYATFTGTHPYVTYPQVQGHEISGVVLELGPEYRGPLAVGERVAVEPTVPCGHCFACRKGRYNCCVDLEVMGAHIPGALAEEIVVDAARVHSAGDLDAELTALVEPVSIGLQAVVRADVRAGDLVVILGAGPIGITATIAAADRGARVVVVDRLPSRLALARQMGAFETVDTTSQDLAAEVQRLSDGDGAGVVIEATGAPAMVRAALQLVAHAGTVVIVGISTQDVSLPIVDFTRKEMTILGSRNNTGLFPESVELVRRHRDRIRALITHRVPMADLQPMVEFAIANPGDVEKVLVRVKEDA